MEYICTIYTMTQKQHGFYTAVIFDLYVGTQMHVKYHNLPSGSSSRVEQMDSWTFQFKS